MMPDEVTLTCLTERVRLLEYRLDALVEALHADPGTEIAYSDVDEQAVNEAENGEGK